MRRCIVNRPSCPSLEGGALILSQAFPLTIKGKDVTALRCSEPLRYKVGGPIKGLASLCGLGPPGVGGDSEGRMYLGSLRSLVMRDEDGSV